MNLRRTPCTVGRHKWIYQFPYSTVPSMADKRWCADCGQVELAYNVWLETYYLFDRWVREEDWHKLSRRDGWDGVAKNRFKVEDYA